MDEKNEGIGNVEQDSTYGSVKPMMQLSLKSQSSSSHKFISDDEISSTKASHAEAERIQSFLSRKEPSFALKSTDPSRQRLQNIDQMLEESLEDEQLSQFEMPISGSLKRDWGKLPFYDYPTD